MLVFRANSANRRTITRFHVLRRQTADMARENFRLVLLIAVIATSVSLVLDVTWMMLAKLG